VKSQMRFPSCYSVWLILSISSGLLCDASDLVGLIQERDGKPIAQASVTDLSRRNASTGTLPDGSFHLGNAVGPLLVEKPSFEPIFILQDALKMSPLHIVLSPGVLSDWMIRPCVTDSRANNPIKELVITVPSGFRKHTNRDADYDLVVFSMTRGREEVELRFWKQAVLTGMPSPRWFEPLREVLTRAISLDGTRGYDVRGVNKAGRVSRWVGCIYTCVEYSEIDSSIAKQLDAVIDGSCYR
jgi:hypothetical protein